MNDKIEIKVDSENKLSVFTVIGVVTVKELIQTIIDFYEHSSTLNTLWDLRRSDLEGFQKKDVENIVNLARKYSDNRPHGKTAIVIGSNDLTHKLSRIYEESINFVPLPFTTQLFIELDEAFEWILSPN